MSPDLKALNQGIPVLDFEAAFAVRNCDFEFQILEKITCTNRHFENLAKPDAKHQAKNRYYHVRVFSHSAVVINGNGPRVSENEEDYLTNMSVQSGNIQGGNWAPALRTRSEGVELATGPRTIRKRMSNGLGELHGDGDPTNSPSKGTKTYSASHRHAAQTALGLSNRISRELIGTPGSFDQIEECSQESSPINFHRTGDLFGDTANTKMVFTEVASGSPADKELIQWPACAPNKPVEPEQLEPQINVEQQSSSNSISWLSENTYINASFIHHPFLGHQERPLIVTQLPLANSIQDFWTMIWENSCPAIVMLCSFKEDESEGAKRYIPNEGATLKIGKFSVLAHELVRGGLVTKRRLRLTNNMSGNSQEVTHYHVRGWEDKDNFKEASFPEMAELLRSLHQERQREAEADDFASGPIVVHCKAGVGRSGVFCSFFFISEFLAALESEVKLSGPRALEDSLARVSVFATVRKLRESRWGLVMSAKQYFNVYEFAQHLIVNSLRKLV